MTEQPNWAEDQTWNVGTDSGAAVQVPDEGLRAAAEPGAPPPAQQASGPAAAEPMDRIDRAEEFADQAGSDAGSNRLLVPRRFTVEVRVGGDFEHVATTRVVHLETQEEDAWPGWSSARLFDFFQRHIGVTDLQHDWGAEPVAPERILGPPAEPAAQSSPVAAEPAAPERWPAEPAAQSSPVAAEPAAPERWPGGPAEPAAAERSHAAAELARGGSAVALLAPADGPPQPALAVHRFGLLSAGQPVVRRGRISARLRLDPSELDLPAGHAAVARAELYAEPVGPGRAEVLDSRTIDLTAVRTVDAVLRGRLPDRDPPFTLFAVVRILVEKPADRPAEGLGTATLELAADEGG